jgi:hypothetical protein
MKAGKVCTKEDPDKEAQVHPDVESVENGSDYKDSYRCLNCSLYFSVEVPC